MKPTNGRHAGTILDCLTSAACLGQHETEAKKAWKFRHEGMPDLWAAYFAGAILTNGAASDGAGHDGAAEGGNEGWEQGGGPGFAEGNQEGGNEGATCYGDGAEIQAESVPEEGYGQDVEMAGSQPVGVIETDNGSHVYVYGEDLIQQPAPALYQGEPVNYSCDFQGATGYGTLSYSYQDHQQFGHAEQFLFFQAGAYQEYHQQQLMCDPYTGEWYDQQPQQYLQQQQQWSQDQQGPYDHQYFPYVQSQDFPTGEYCGGQQDWYGQEWSQQQWVEDQHQQCGHAPQRRRRGRRYSSRHQRPANGYRAHGGY